MSVPPLIRYFTFHFSSFHLFLLQSTLYHKLLSLSFLRVHSITFRVSLIYLRLFLPIACVPFNSLQFQYLPFYSFQFDSVSTAFYSASSHCLSFHNHCPSL